VKDPLEWVLFTSKEDDLGENHLNTISFLQNNWGY